MAYVWWNAEHSISLVHKCSTRLESVSNILAYRSRTIWLAFVKLRLSLQGTSVKKMHLTLKKLVHFILYKHIIICLENTPAYLCFRCATIYWIEELFVFANISLTGSMAYVWWNVEHSMGLVHKCPTKNNFKIRCLLQIFELVRKYSNSMVTTIDL